jgi:nucleoside-diphosphate-sugar epimerase
VPRYFVTGATGFVGAELVKQLIGRGHHVVALVRSPEKASLLHALGVEIHPGDIRDRDSLRAPMQGVDGLFHVAAWYKIGVRGARAIAHTVNVEGTRHVLDVASELRVPRIVYTSTVGVFGDTRGRVVDETYCTKGPFLTDYDETKWKAHYEVALPMIQQGLPLIIVMPGLVYGPGDTSAVRATLVQLLKGRLFATPSGVTFSWTYIEDVARGLLLAMEKGRIGESYLLTGPPHTFQEAFALAARLAGRRAPPVHPPPALMRAAASLAGVFERYDLRLPVAAETLRLMAGTTWIGSSEKAARELGFTARPLADGWRHTIEHEKRQLGLA